MTTITAEQYAALVCARMSEATFQAQVIKLAEALMWVCYHTHDSRRSAAGFPDLVLVRSKVIYAELKVESRSRGKVTIEQQAWIDALRNAGQYVYVWRPSDMPEIQRILA